MHKSKTNYTFTQKLKLIAMKNLKKQPIAGHIQVYSVWVNGRDIDDNDQHFPIIMEDCHEWTNNFKNAVRIYNSVKVSDIGEHGLYSEIYSDYIVILFSIDINIKEFENKFDLDFDIENDDVQEMIPYYVDYDFNTVAERTAKFTSVEKRLEYLRRELRAESISYGELEELQSLAEYIEPGDVELLEAAGVPEFEE